MKKKGVIGTVTTILALGFAIGTMGLNELIANVFYEESAEGYSVKSTEATGEMEVTFLDVGQGDCTIFRTGDHVMMMDTGDNGTGDEVVAYLEQEGIDSLDYLILTHPDSDHIGGADNVLEAVEVETVLMPDVPNDTKTYDEVIQDIDYYEIDVIYPQPEEVYTLGEAEFMILSPEPEIITGEYVRGMSVGIKLVHGENSFVLTGDAEEDAELAMVERFGDKLECDVLKLGHHGSSTSTTDEFLAVTNPSWGIISCGVGNSYGHPHAETLAKMEDDDVIVYRTDTMGTIIAISDGKDISWSSER